MSSCNPNEMLPDGIKGIKTASALVQTGTTSEGGIIQLGESEKNVQKASTMIHRP